MAHASEPGKVRLARSSIFLRLELTGTLAFHFVENYGADILENNHKGDLEEPGKNGRFRTSKMGLNMSVGLKLMLRFSDVWKMKIIIHQCKIDQE